MKKSDKKSAPLIGVTGPSQRGSARLHRLIMRRAMRRAVIRAGGEYLYLDGIDSCPDINALDGLLITGGSDINPALYNQAPHPETHKPDHARDTLEIRLAREALAAKIPTLGICRGMQMINVANGGTLHQYLPDVFPAYQPRYNPYRDFPYRKPVRLVKETKLAEIFSPQKTIQVNSLHRQGADQIADNLVTSACDDLGITQALEAAAGHNHPFYIGVQWHPELMIHQQEQLGLFKAFIGAALARKRLR